jgi:hypothetical protein
MIASSMLATGATTSCFSANLRLIVREVVTTKNDILFNVQNWRTVSRLKQVLTLAVHQAPRASFCAAAESGTVDSHLVAVEVSVETLTNEWVKLNSLTLDKLWLER